MGIQCSAVHACRYPGSDGNADSPRRKFSALHRRKVETGNPRIPFEVRHAKTVRDLMKKRADLGEGDDVDDDFDDFDEEEEEADSVEVEDSAPCAESTGSHSLALPAPRAPSFTPPRPLVHRRSTMRTTAGNGEGDLFAILKMQMVEDRARREEEREARAAERAQHREEERARRERVDRRHDQFMQLLLNTSSKPRGFTVTPRQ